MNGDAWHDIQISTLEIAGGILLGAPLALLASLLLSKSRDIHPIVDAILPATYLSPIAMWLLVFLLVSPTSGLYMGVGQKTVAAGFLTFFPILRALRAFHDATLLQRWALAVDDALPIAFVGILFAELYAATAGLGFWMTVASATQQYQQGLAGFFVTAALFTGISIFLRATARH
jgi:ABC-type nitrate/sulfonate/bicarbonate transport system permease component